jgi:glycosyltransferase involved in cell wall biosynthesis
MHIGVVSTHVAGGGAEDVAAKTIKLLIEEGHSVTLYTRDSVSVEDYRRFYGEELKCSIAVRKALFDAKLFPTRYRFLTNELWLKGSRDGVLLDLSPSIVPLYLRNPKLVYFHNVPKFDLSIANSGLMKLAFCPYNAFARYLVRKFVADEHIHMIANSRFTQARLARCHVKARVIYPPVDLDQWRRPMHHNQRRGIVSLARFAPQDPQKRHDWQLEIVRGRKDDLIAMGNCLNSSQEAHLSKLRENAPSNVRFVTNAPLETVRDILSRRKVFLHTAFEEPFGMSIVQSIAAGCIPLVHDSGGPREIVPMRELRFKTVSEAKIKLDQVLRGEYDHFMPALRDHIEGFSTKTFKDGMLREIFDAA